MDELSSEQIQQILDENSNLIKMILKCQNENRIMDSMLFQARLQNNLLILAPFAKAQENSTSVPNGIEPASSAKSQLSKFVQAVKESGLKDLKLISALTDIPLEKIVPLAQAYIAFLKRQNSFTEAQHLEYELSLNGADSAV